MWCVGLQGNESDLVDLAGLYADDWKVERQDRCFYLTAPIFDTMNNPSDVYTSAQNLLTIIWGAAQIHYGDLRPVAVDHIKRFGEDGRFVFSSAHCHGRTKVRASLTVLRADGTVEGPEPNRAVSAWVSLARNDTTVKKVVDLYATLDHTWRNLYFILEIVQDDMGDWKAFVKHGWVTNDRLKVFKRTAQSSAAIGPEARHGRAKYTPPPHPMTIKEARALTQTILRLWLEAKQQRVNASLV